MDWQLWRNKTPKDLWMRSIRHLRGTRELYVLHTFSRPDCYRRLRLSPDQPSKRLAGLTGLGAPTDLVAKSRDVLVEIISKAANIDDEMKAALETRLNEAAPSNVKLAAVHKRRRRPDEIGQTGGGGGGAPGAAS